MNERRTATVHFPDGDRQIEPDSWRREDGKPEIAIFRIPGYRVIAVNCFKYIAVAVDDSPIEPISRSQPVFGKDFDR